MELLPFLDLQKVFEDSFHIGQALNKCIHAEASSLNVPSNTPIVRSLEIEALQYPKLPSRG